MAETNSQRPPSVGITAPFLLTAPVAVAAAGAMLLAYGERALLDSWSPVTMGLTHFGTLGFLSMVLIGAFYRIAPELLARPIRGGRLPLFVHLAFSVGVAALCIGLAGYAVTPVFVAIGTLFPALAGFFWPAIAALRGTRNQPSAQPLRLAIGAFLIVAILGIWVAHGHGGMKFPGPRPFWIQLHLSIALFGWVGGMTAAVLVSWTTNASAAANPDEAAAPQLPRGWARLTLLGIALPTFLLAANYAGLFEVAPIWARWIGAMAALPAALASGVLLPVWGFARLRDDAFPQIERHYWLASFALAPIALASGVAALWLDPPATRVAFGWLAIWGWGGLTVHAILRGLHREKPAASEPRRDLAFALHLFSLLVGLAAIASGAPWLARLTGCALIVVAGVQLTQLVAALRAASAHAKAAAA